MNRRLAVALMAPLAIAFAVARPAGRTAEGGIAPAVAAAEDSAAALFIRRRVESGLERDIRSTEAVRSFYGTRGYAAAWSGPYALSRSAGALRDALADAPAHGLDPAVYHLERIDGLLRALGTLPLPARQLSAARRAELDILLTDAFLTFGAHLLRGRVDPRSVHPSWNLPIRERDLAELLEQALRDQEVPGALAGLVPADPGYLPLQKALGRYRALQARGGWERLGEGKVLRPGDDSPAVPALRERLRVELPVAPGDAATLYDESLASVVRAFQRDRGLEPDGVVGPGTRAALNVPVEERIRQLELSLERLRWLPVDLGRRHIRVSIPAFELQVVEEGRVQLAMRIVGGRPDWRTPIFSAEMTSVVLSPYWNIPASIAAQEVVPDARRDPGYLERNEIRVVTGYGERERVVSPWSIDWSRFNPRTSRFRLRQDPGPANPLGAVKFLFPNRYNVYLHDTPSRQLFARAERAFSHGCMRIEKPMELAEYLLGPSGWEREEMEAVIAGHQERSVALPAGVPVHILYRTAWVDAEGRVQFREDLYGHDGTLARALRGPLEVAVGVTECGMVGG